MSGSKHLRPDVSWGNILSTIGIIITLVVGWGKIQSEMAIFRDHIEAETHIGAEQRLDAIEASQARMEAEYNATNLRIESLQRELLGRLDRVDVKLDRIEERINQPDLNRL